MTKNEASNLPDDLNLNDEFFLKSLGQFLKRMRIAAGFRTIRAFTDTVDMSYSQYQGYESGKNITILILKKILFQFNIKVGEWLILDILNNENDESVLIENMRQARIDQVIEQVKIVDGLESVNELRTKDIQRYIDILIYCHIPKGRTEILTKLLKMDDTVNTLQRVAGKLITYGWLNYTDPNNRKNPNQKYYTTDIGKTALRLVK